MINRRYHYTAAEKRAIAWDNAKSAARSARQLRSFAQLRREQANEWDEEAEASRAKGRRALEILGELR